jgi:hypothetical protein
MTESTIIRQEREALSLAFAVEPAGVTVSRLDGAITFGPLCAWVRIGRVQGKMQNLVSTLISGWAVEEAVIETPLGSIPGLRAVLDQEDARPVRLIWELALGGGEELLGRLRLENHDRDALRVFELAPLAYRGADPGLDMGAGYPGWRFYRAGYQSWTPAGSLGVMDADFKPRFFFPSRSGTNPLTPYSRRPGEKAADWMGQVVEPRLGYGTLLGFITTAGKSGRVELEVRYDRFRRLEAISDGEGTMLAPGAESASEWVMLSLSRDPLGQHERYLEAWARAMKARPGRPRTGWCTWYFAFWNVSEEVVDRNLPRLEDDFKGALDLVQLDDGFEPVLGEWLEWK